MWDECGIGLYPIDHIKRREIFTRLHHFDIFLGFCCCWSRGLDMIGPGLALHWRLGGLVRISIGLEDLQWIGELAMNLEISTWVMDSHICNGLALYLWIG